MIKKDGKISKLTKLCNKMKLKTEKKNLIEKNITDFCERCQALWNTSNKLIESVMKKWK